MSGIEIAGLVLAAFPVIVQGLQQISESVGTVKSWKRSRHELNNYCRTLESEKIALRNTIELLFEGILQLDEELEAAISDPEGALSQYEMKLKCRLGNSYPIYIRLMENLLKMLKSAQEELEIDDQGNVLV